MADKNGLAGDELRAKKIEEIRGKLSTQKVDYDFHSNGIPVTSVEPESARGILGGQWKNRVLSEPWGAEVIQNDAQYDGNRPIDIQLRALIVNEHTKYFAEGEKIEFEGNDDKGIYTVLAKTRTSLIVLCPFQGNDKGKVFNKSRIDGLIKAQKKNETILEQLNANGGVPATIGQVTETEIVEQNPNSTPAKKTSYRWIFWLLLTVAILMIAFKNKN